MKAGGSSKEKHIVIAGAGIIGLSIAFYALRKGHRVTIIERSPEVRDGCSFGNAGMVVPSHFVPLAAPGMVALGLKWMWNPESPFYVKPRLDWDLLRWGFRFWCAANPRHVSRSAPLLRDLSLASRACFEELAELSDNEFQLVRNGLLMLCKTQHTLDEEAKTAHRARELGIPAEVLDAKQTGNRDPGVRMDIVGSVYFPNDCHLSPHLLMTGLKARLDQAGARFVWSTEVQGWRIQDSRIEAVQTAVGDFSADEFVLCAGSWSPIAARGLRLDLPVQAGKGYSLTLPDPPQLPRICAIFSEARIAATPMGKTLRFGGTMEIAGLNESINPIRVRGITQSVPIYYPEFARRHFEGVKPWLGLRPCSPDGLPYIGRPRRYQNLVIATGHAMMGLSLGPITGKLVAEILSGERPSVDIHLLQPDRFG